MALNCSIKISLFCKSLLLLSLSLFFLFNSCSGLKQSEEERIKKRNVKVEPILRHSNEQSFALEIPKHKVRDKYPWEEKYQGNLVKITKDFFRCRGSSRHPPLKQEVDTSTYLFDCKGPEHHSLPIKNSKEFVYPILINLLNYLQKETGKKVIITCGHRCPSHNTYADASISNQASKHMVGAEVDFYVQGYENKPEEIIRLLMKYYESDPKVRNQKDYTEFKRYDKSDSKITTAPWLNKEILIKLYQKNEGRDIDNRHPYPYISVQVRMDRETGEKVTASWQKANSCLLRY